MYSTVARDFITGLDFDSISKDNTPEGVTPSSVDCILCHDGWTNFIEFKGDPFKDYTDECGGKVRVKERVKLKAVESIHLYREFLETSEPTKGYRLIIVFRTDDFTYISDSIAGDPEQREPPNG